MKIHRNSRGAWRSLCLYAIVISPMPVGVTFRQDSLATDGRQTSLQVAAGSGSFDREISVGYTSSSGCASSQPVRFRSDFTDVGAELDYGSGERHIGVRGGIIQETTSLADHVRGAVDVDSIAATIDSVATTAYFNPYFAREAKWFGVGAGVILSTRPLRTGTREEYPLEAGAAVHPSGHLRLGPRFLYGSMSTGESVPIYSGGGIQTVGLGLAPVRFLDVWGGKSTGPWHGESWLFKVGIHPTRNWSLHANARLEKDRTCTYERGHGASVGVTRRFGGE